MGFYSLCWACCLSLREAGRAVSSFLSLLVPHVRASTSGKNGVFHILLLGAWGPEAMSQQEKTVILGQLLYCISKFHSLGATVV